MGARGGRVCVSWHGGKPLALIAGGHELPPESDGKRIIDGGEVSSGLGADWFWVVQASPRGGEVFVSLPDELVICGQLLSGPDRHRRRAANRNPVR